ncbi:MAG: phosphate signaling complex protein PhoU [Verrucomicrobiota bacterium]
MKFGPLSAIDEMELEPGLEQLHASVFSLSRVVRQQVENAVQALLSGSSDSCDAVIAADDETDEEEKAISQLGFELLTRFRPGGRELRFIIGSMNVARTLERIADHAVQVAKRSRKILRQGQIVEVNLIEPMYALAMEELRGAMACFVDGNVEVAEELANQDRNLDKIHKKLAKSLSRMVEERHDGVVGLLHLMFVGRSLERIGDLSVKVAEEVVFIESAEDVRHQH